MKKTIWTAAVGAVTMLTFLPTAGRAQDEPQPPQPGGGGFPGQGFPGQGVPGQGGPGGFQGPRPQGGGFGQGPMRPMMMPMMGNSLVNIPLEALANGLKLTDEQKEKIAAIQDENRPRPFMPPGQQPGGPGQPGEPGQPGQPGGGGFNGRPGGFGGGDPRRANAEIKAILTDSQKAALPNLLKEVEIFRSVDLPVDLIGKITLTDDQRAKLILLAFDSRPDFDPTLSEAMEGRNPSRLRSAMEKHHQETMKKAQAILTAEQRAAVEKWNKEHPRPVPGEGPGAPPPPAGQ